ncbi:DUF4412 domain-containing protein [Tamlana sp. 2_MG-2023]|uniref:DUF4412 domain-containing protein n=1 Tax=unclassified Tamlana TaxID=2614803 RepID=UPI0026E34E6E|nr:MULTISPECIES: DUF4412 domain-containing protein [unclassified Tamlana]MDO6758900.1 DUF4412 domain-containing protein [Tamlana sp. 2_MG-2023]MDO6789599.1 DUF4412 domain-containing protein [Tamlana sp. 1_MG-2023]
MKNQILLFVIVIFLLPTRSEAQFLRKLKARVEAAAEETVLDRTAERVAEKSSEGVDKIFDVNFKGNGKSVKMEDASILPETYSFNWRYSLKMITDKGDMLIDYYLMEAGEALGVNPNPNDSSMNMFMVLDSELNVNVMFMDSGASKMGSVTSMDNMDIVDVVDDEVDTENKFTYNKIGKKKILGHHCQGYKIESDEADIELYIYENSPVSFDFNFSSSQKNIPNGFDPKLLKNIEKGMVMEMVYMSKKKSKDTFKMECVGFEEESKDIAVSDYQFMNVGTMNSPND